MVKLALVKARMITRLFQYQQELSYPSRFCAAHQNPRTVALSHQANGREGTVRSQ